FGGRSRRSRAARPAARDLSPPRRRFPAAACRNSPAPALCNMIEIDRVTKRYGERLVVDRLSLTIPAGGFCVLLGSSGSGKSTTLRMINRLTAIDSGSIRVGGEDVRGVPAEVLRRRVGYAIQSIGLFSHWTVEDNIATVPPLLRSPQPTMRRRVA